MDPLQILYIAKYILMHSKTTMIVVMSQNNLFIVGLQLTVSIYNFFCDGDQ